MTLRETVKEFVKAREFKELVKFLSPIAIERSSKTGRLNILIMRPRWVNGHFEMCSINKFKD